MVWCARRSTSTFHETNRSLARVFLFDLRRPGPSLDLSPASDVEHVEQWSSDGSASGGLAPIEWAARGIPDEAAMKTRRWNARACVVNAAC